MKNPSTLPVLQQMSQLVQDFGNHLSRLVSELSPDYIVPLCASGPDAPQQHRVADDPAIEGKGSLGEDAVPRRSDEVR